MSDVPPELLFEILVRLPPKDLIRSLCVSKAWYAFIHDQCFIKSRIHNSIETNSFCTLQVSERKFWKSAVDFFASPVYDNDTFGTTVKIRHPLKYPGEYTCIVCCSVHGMVCICNESYGDIDLWNPSIQKFKKIPLPTSELQQPSSDLRLDLKYGFGYDSTNDFYKIVKLVQFSTRDNVIVGSQVNVYSLKSNSWKMIENMPCNGFKMHEIQIIFLNGVLNWVMYNLLDINQNIILTLDLTSEKCHQSPTHTFVDVDIMSLEVLGDSLCTCRWRYWEILKENGVNESWTMLYSIRHGDVPWLYDSCKPLVLSKNGEVNFFILFFMTDMGRLCWVDLAKKNVKEIEIGGHHYCSEATIYMGSLCLLDGDP